MMEDLLLIREKDKSKDLKIQQTDMNADISLNNSKSSKSDLDKKENKNDEENENIENTKKPPEKLLVNYNKWHYFLITWKRLELLKLEWVRRKLGIEQINTPEAYARYW